MKFSISFSFPWQICWIHPLSFHLPLWFARTERETTDTRKIEKKVENSIWNNKKLKTLHEWDFNDILVQLFHRCFSFCSQWSKIFSLLDIETRLSRLDDARHFRSTPSSLETFSVCSSDPLISPSLHNNDALNSNQPKMEVQRNGEKFSNLNFTLSNIEKMFITRSIHSFELFAVHCVVVEFFCWLIFIARRLSIEYHCLYQSSNNPKNLQSTVFELKFLAVFVVFWHFM